MQAVRFVVALAGALVVAGAAAAQAEDPFLLDPDEYGPDFGGEPPLVESDDVLLVQDELPEFGEPLSDVFDDPAFGDDSGEPEADEEPSTPPPATSASGGKKTPAAGAGLALVVAAAAALVAAGRRVS